MRVFSESIYAHTIQVIDNFIDFTVQVFFFQGQDIFQRQQIILTDPISKRDLFVLSALIFFISKPEYLEVHYVLIVINSSLLYSLYLIQDINKYLIGKVNSFVFNNNDSFF